MNRQFNFTDTTKRIISERAGYRCSFDGCDKQLIGPGEGSTDVLRLGELGHIYSGAAEGPRYERSITEQELKSPHNGILLCRHHHRLIDQLDSKYSVAEVVRMKHRHEYRIAAELQGIVHPSIWIESFTIQGFPLFEQKTKIEFGQVNHIYGDAGAGKTAILELLNGVLYGSDIERWRDFDIDLSITLSSSSGNNFAVDTTIRKGRPSYAISNNFAITFPEPYFVVFLQKEVSSHSDDLAAIAKCYGMSPIIFENLVRNPSVRGLTTSEYSLNICRTVPYLVRDLMVNVGNSSTQSFGSCSISEKSRVILDFGVLIASQMCRYRPVALLVDWINIGVLDIERFLPYVDYLFSSRAMFQTWFISPDPIRRLPWRGWQKIKIERAGLKSVITQLGA